MTILPIFIAFMSLQKRFGVKIITVNNAPTGEVDLEDLERKCGCMLPSCFCNTCTDEFRFGTAYT